MKRSELKEYFRRQYTLLVEQEEEEDPFATDEGGDEEEEPTEDEAPEDEAPEGEDAESEEEEDEEEVKVDEEDKQRFQRSIDDHLQALLIDIEADAIKSAAVQEEGYSLKRLFLLESETSDVTLDVDKFASEVARLILNFDAFVDVEELMLTKVRNFLTDKHGSEVADEVEELLAGRHDIKRKEDKRHEEEQVEEQVPIAVGAYGAGGGGGV
jgi:hypothetical protein